jgi:hypothetical protein
MARRDHPAAPITDALANTVQQGTARLQLSWRADFTETEPAEAEAAWYHSSGTVVFPRRRYEIEGDDPSFWDNGRKFTHPPGAPGWAEAGSYGDPPPPGDVFWLLDLVGGVEAISPVDGTSATERRYRCQVDVVQADAASPHGLALPGGYSLRQLRNLTIDVALDGLGRIKSISCAVDAWEIRLELSAFGKIADVRLPTE